MTQETFTSDRVAKVCRFVLLTAIAVVGALILTAPQSEVGLGKPYMMRSAFAEMGGGGGIASAPGYLLMTQGSASTTQKFYIVETNKQVICEYTSVGDRLRLIAARKFDYDDIPDCSIVGVRTADGRMALSPEQGGNGITRDEAKLYGDGVKALLDANKPK